MRVDQAVHTGSAGDWNVASSALLATRSMVHTDRDRQVLELIEGYYRLAALERDYKEGTSLKGSAVPPPLRAQMLECRDHWLRPYLEYFDPVQPPAADNACVRAPRPDVNQRAM
jgi:hypothetical protein